MSYMMVTFSERTTLALGHQVAAPTLAETVARKLLKQSRSGDLPVRDELDAGNLVTKIPMLHEAAQGLAGDLARAILSSWPHERAPLSRYRRFRRGHVATDRRPDNSAHGEVAAVSPTPQTPRAPTPTASPQAWARTSFQGLFCVLV